MVDLAGKTIAVAGKLAGRYATARGELQGRLKQVGATLLDDFTASADVVVLAAKSKGFAKRVRRAGVPTLSEAELEAAVLHVFDSPPVVKPVRSFHEQEMAASLRPAARSPAPRVPLLEALDAAMQAGYRVFDSPPDGTRTDWPPVKRTSAPRSVLAWCEFDGLRLFAVPERSPGSALDRDLSTLRDAVVYTEDDCPLPVFGAAMRTLVAMGDDAANVWGALAGELDNRDGHLEAGVESLAALQAVQAELAPHVLTSPAQLNFEIRALFVVVDNTTRN